MDGEFSVLKPNQYEYIAELDKLLNLGKFSPIYSKRFFNYYSSIAANSYIDLSRIIRHQGSPIIALVGCGQLISGKSRLDYFGNPAILISSPNFDSVKVEQALDLLLTSLRKTNIPLPIENKFPNSFAIKINSPNIIEARLFNDLLKKSNKSFVAFSLRVKLDREISLISELFSKSVKESIRFRKMHEIDVEIIDEFKSEAMIENAMDQLKILHHESAGRKTRSDESWRIQTRQLMEGDAFIAHLIINGDVVSSAYFMKTNFDSYYGVSASRRLKSKIPLSHLCVREAIFYSKQIGLQNLFLGHQYSYFSQSITDKEKNIEKFKSFFGGVLSHEVVCEL